jgi:hypothetical protein
MTERFLIIKGTPTEQELVALEKAIPLPAVKKLGAASLWRKSQMRQPLSKKWGPTF